MLSTITVLISVVLIILTFFKWRFTYWKRQGIPQLEPTLLFGNMRDLILQKCSVGEQYLKHYNTIRSKKLKFAGMYFSFKPMLLIADPDLINTMLIKDFPHFINHGFYVNAKKDPLGAHLFNLEDNEWKKMRQKLTPTFTSGKIKMMFETIHNCAKGLKTIMDKSIESQQPIDIKEVMSCFSTDVIGSVAFGIECNSLENPECEFRRVGRKIFLNTPLENIEIMLILTLPRFILKYTNLRLTKSYVESFFMELIHKMVNLRETTKIIRKDFLQLLLELKNHEILDEKEMKEDTLTLNQLAAQAYLFFIAGFETTSTTLNFTMYELALNQSIQDKLRNEIRTVLKKYDGKISYEALNEMVYMDRVIYETLRKHPPLPVLNRKSTKNYTIPDTSICIEKGTEIVFLLNGIQSDPNYYPDPEKFDPDRFLNEDKKPWIPFGDGPRICIGMRFAMVEMKISLSEILNNYKFKLNSKTIFPIKIIPAVFIKTVEGSVWLDVEKV